MAKTTSELSIAMIVKGVETLKRLSLVPEKGGRTDCKDHHGRSQATGNNARGSGDKISEITGKVGAVASQAKDEAVRAAEEEAIEAATKNGAIKAKKVKTPDLYLKNRMQPRVPGRRNQVGDPWAPFC